MKTIAVIMVAKNRADFFKRSMASLRTGKHIKVCVMAQVSKDSTQQDAIDLYRTGDIDTLVMEDSKSMNDATWRGSYLMEHHKPDLYLFTADDYVYREGWDDVIREVCANPSISHMTLELEPLFPWNAPIMKIIMGQYNVLIRETIPGACWAMSRERWLEMRDYFSLYMNDPLCDHAVNAWTRKTKQLAAVNYAEHIGAYSSVCGNRAFQVDAKPLPEEWKV